MIVLSSLKVMEQGIERRNDGDSFTWGGQGSFLRSDIAFGE